MDRPRIRRPPTASYRKSRIAFENLHLEFGSFAIFPKAGSKFDAIAESPSIPTVSAFEGSRNADKLSLDEFAGRVDNRVAVAAHVDKRKVW